MLLAAFFLTALVFNAASALAPSSSPYSDVGWQLEHGWPSSTQSAIETGKDGLAKGGLFGQVTSVHVDDLGRVWVLHRTPERVWNSRSFDSGGAIRHSQPIAGHTIIRYPSEDAARIDLQAGQHALQMPHSLTIDLSGNVWIVDCGLHQVLKFLPGNLEKPVLTLGTALQPGSDHSHFCKPTDVAVRADGAIYVSDGYCNARIVQFDSSGNFVRSWGTMGSGPGQFRIPHSLAWDEGAAQLFVADRQNTRVQVFDGEGSFLREIPAKIFNSPVFAVALDGGERGHRRLFVSTGEPIGQVHVLHAGTGEGISRFRTPRASRGQIMPHDVFVSARGTVFVAESKLNTLLKYTPASSNNRNDTLIARHHPRAQRRNGGDSD